MKTLSEMQAVVDEIRQVCAKHGVVIVGTCDNEGIYGEITIQQAGTEGAWRAVHKQIDNKAVIDSGGVVSFRGAGDWIEEPQP